MKKNFNRGISMLLSVAMLISLLTVGAYAEGEDTAAAPDAAAGDQMPEGMGGEGMGGPGDMGGMGGPGGGEGGMAQNSSNNNDGVVSIEDGVVTVDEDWAGVNGLITTEDGVTTIDFGDEEWEHADVTNGNYDFTFLNASNSDVVLKNAVIELGVDAEVEGTEKAGEATYINSGMLTIDNCYIQVDGAGRYTIATEDTGVTVVRDSSIVATGNADGMTGNVSAPRSNQALGISGTSRSNFSVGQSQTYYYNSYCEAEGWAAMSTDSATGTGLDFYGVNSVAVALHGGYGIYADTNCRDWLYGSALYSAEIGAIISNNGSVTIGATADATEDALKYAEDGEFAGENEDASYDGYVVAGRNDFQLHSPDMMGEGNSDYQAQLTVSNTVLETVDMSEGYEILDGTILQPTFDYSTYSEGFAAYINYVTGANILLKSTSGNIQLDNVTTVSSTGVFLLSAMNSDGMSRYLKTDCGKGIVVNAVDSELNGSIVHDDYQRDMVVTLDGTTLNGAVNYSTYEDVNAAWAEYKDDENMNWILDADTYITDTHDTDLTLVNGAVWNVSADSQLTSLVVDDTSSVVIPKGVTVTVETGELAGTYTNTTIGASADEGFKYVDDNGAGDWTWASSYIYNARTLGYMNGDDAGTFRASAELTRAEAVIIALAVKGIKADTDVKNSGFSDANNQWFSGYVAAAKAAGITSGDPEGTFRPDDSVTRAEFITMMLAAKGVNVDGKDTSMESGFSDANNAWYTPYIAAAKACGMVDGYSNGTVKPNANVTRAEAAVMAQASKVEKGQIGSYGSGDVDDYYYNAALYVQDGAVVDLYSNTDRISDGTYDATKADGVVINDSASGHNGIIIVDSAYTITSADIDLITTADGSNTNDFSGKGTAIAVYGEKSNVTIDNSNIKVAGVAGMTVFADSGSTVTIKNSVLDSEGGTIYASYVNTAAQNMMVAPPWILGIYGTSRCTNLEGNNTTMNILDTTATAGNWAGWSTDSGSNMVLNMYGSTMTLTHADESAYPFQAEGGQLENLDDPYTTNYGAGYGTYTIGNAAETFAGTTLNVGTYGTIFTGGSCTFTSIKAGETYTLANGNDNNTITYTASEDQVATINSDTFGIMCHQGSNTLNMEKGTVVNSGYTAFLMKSGSSNASMKATISDTTINAENGVIIQVMDNDDATNPAPHGLDAEGNEVSMGPDAVIAPVFATYHDEADGWNTEASTEAKDADPSAAGPGYVANDGSAKMDFTFNNEVLEGNMYNASGAEGLTPVPLYVTLNDSTLKGAISATTAIHTTYEGSQVVKENGGVAFENGSAEAEAFEEAYHNEHFTISHYYDIGQVANMVNYNGQNNVYVTLKNTTWTVTSTSYITTLTMDKDSEVVIPEGVTLIVITGDYAGTYTNTTIPCDSLTITSVGYRDTYVATHDGADYINSPSASSNINYVTLSDGTVVNAEDDGVLTLVVHGDQYDIIDYLENYTTLEEGTYSFATTAGTEEHTEMAKFMNMAGQTAQYTFRSALKVNADGIVDSETIPALLTKATYDASGIKNGELNTFGAFFNGIIVNNANFSISNMEITAVGDGANDFAGEAAVVYATGTANVTVEDTVINTTGVIRTATAVTDNGIMNINNSVIYAQETKDTQEEYSALVVPMMKRTPFALGLEGCIRATNVLGAGQGIYTNSLIVSTGWGVLSTDSGKGYSSTGTYALDVSKTVAGTGTIELAKAGTEYFATKTVGDTTYGYIAGGSGYVAYADSGVWDKFDQVNFYGGNEVQIMASSTSSAFYTNSTLTSGHIGVMTQQNAGGTISIVDSILNVGETGIQIKSGAANSGYTNVVLDDTIVNFTNEDAKWGGTLVELVESDDAGNPGNTTFTVNDTGDEATTDTATAVVDASSAELRNGAYTGNIWNNIYNKYEVLNVTLFNAVLNGTISSSYGYHLNDDGTRMENGTTLQADTTGNYLTSGVTDYAKIGAQYNVANEQVNNPINVTLDQGSRWNIVLADGTNGEAKELYINDLTIGMGSTVDSETPVTIHVYGTLTNNGTIGENVKIVYEEYTAPSCSTNTFTLTDYSEDKHVATFTVVDESGNPVLGAVKATAVHQFTCVNFGLEATGYEIVSVTADENGTLLADQSGDVCANNAQLDPGATYCLTMTDSCNITVVVKAASQQGGGMGGMGGGDMGGGDMGGGMPM